MLGAITEVWKAGSLTFHRGSWRPVRWAWHRIFCLGNWLCERTYLCFTPVTKLVWQVLVQNFRWTDGLLTICRELQVHFATVLLWEFDGKIILGNFALDKSWSTFYHQNWNIFYHTQRSHEPDSLKKVTLKWRISYIIYFNKI